MLALFRGAASELDVRLGDAVVESFAVGSRPVALDRRPLVGPTAIAGVHLATGTYRNGVLLAPLVAELVATGVADPHALAAHPWAASRPVVPAGLDRAGPARARRAWWPPSPTASAFGPGRHAELTAFVEEALAQFLDPAADGAAVARRGAPAGRAGPVRRGRPVALRPGGPGAVTAPAAFGGRLAALVAEHARGPAPDEVAPSWQDLGIDSLGLVSFVVACEDALGVEVPDRVLAAPARPRGARGLARRTLRRRLTRAGGLGQGGDPGADGVDHRRIGVVASGHDERGRRSERTGCRRGPGPGRDRSALGAREP